MALGHSSDRRTAGRRRIRIVTATVAGVAVAGSVGLAIVVAQDGPVQDGPAEATTATTPYTGSTPPSASDTWRPSTGGVGTAPSNRAPQATSGGS